MAHENFFDDVPGFELRSGSDSTNITREMIFAAMDSVKEDKLGPDQSFLEELKIANRRTVLQDLMQDVEYFMNGAGSLNYAHSQSVTQTRWYYFLKYARHLVSHHSAMKLNTGQGPPYAEYMGSTISRDMQVGDAKVSDYVLLHLLIEIIDFFESKHAEFIDKEIK